MKKQLNTKYNHVEVEKGHYQNWIDKDYFTANELDKIPYCMVIPPPNVTGKLHLGHAWDTTLQDIIARYKRLQGYDVLWLAGMDHAGIATQAKVDARLKEEGISRYEIGREAFLKKSWEWKEEYANHIREQWATLGLSLDYSREHFTLDDTLSAAVKKVFVDLYQDGLIYQGERIINWDPEAKTALSNIEVVHKEIEGAMYYFKYKIVETGNELVIATTRPETMFADQAIFVHPEDTRYQNLVGMHVINPANNEELLIMADDYIDMEFGTAVMKCTPAHDPNDFNLAKKYHLPMPICMNLDGTMNHLAHVYEGMDRFQCREALVKDFEVAGVVDHIDTHIHQVGHSERTGVVVEPYLSKQWFVKMEPLAAEVLKYQKNTATKINFTPKRFENTFDNWLENIEDWCISRQLWWGHRIPAWYHKHSDEIYVGMVPPTDSENWVQDEDVLDTWFSSALWPFSTLGWPEKTADFERYYPNDTLVTGYDIIFFWVARMAFQARYFTNTRPFKDVLMHGLVRDAQGRKMSKSLGNGIDPMDVIENYGCDALRFFLTTNSTPGQDLRFMEEKVEASSNFINKIWNASKFVIMNLEDDFTMETIDLSKGTMIDQWIIKKFNEMLASMTSNMDKFEFALAGNELYSFLWEDFCNWYIELSKAGLSSDHEVVRNATQSTLVTILKNVLCMLHPFMPFVSEEIYLALPHSEESINLETWPKPIAMETVEEDMEAVKQLISMICAVRTIRVDYQLKPNFDIEVILHDTSGKKIDCTDKINAILQKMCHASWVDKVFDEELVVRPVFNGTLSVPLAKLMNVEEEIEKLEKELLRLQQEIKRGKGMLANDNFIKKAPQAKVDAEKEKLATYQTQFDVVKQRLEELNT